jgi:hypothetical protein
MGAFVVCLMGGIYARLFGGTAYTATVPGILCVRSKSSRLGLILNPASWCRCAYSKSSLVARADACAGGLRCSWWTGGLCVVLAYLRLTRARSPCRRPVTIPTPVASSLGAPAQPCAVSRTSIEGAQPADDPDSHRHHHGRLRGRVCDLRSRCVPPAVFVRVANCSHPVRRKSRNDAIYAW